MKQTKETIMKTLNLKAVTSAFAALAITFVLSWTFVDATAVARVHTPGGAAFVAAISALVR
jgi:hypothetical protein